MKISFVEPHLKLYGGIRRIVELSNRLSNLGHKVTIYHSDGSNCEWMECNAKIKSYKEVLEEEHQVIVYNDPNPTDYELVKRSRAKLKVYYCLGLLEHNFLKKSIVELYLLPSKYSRIRVLKQSLCAPYLQLSNSTWMREWLKKNLRLETELLVGGVNFAMFHPVEVSKKNEIIRILCSGDPREGKGSETIFEATKIAQQIEPRIVLDTYYNVGIPQEKMAEKYSCADIFVDGQLAGGWNNPVAEAMACGVAVVCTDIGGVKDFAINNETALLVPPQDPRAMALAILRLCKDIDFRQKLRCNALSHIRQFNWDKSAKKLEEILVYTLNNPMPSISMRHHLWNFSDNLLALTSQQGYRCARILPRPVKTAVMRSLSKFV